jgi:hypothetical protein
MAAENCDFSWDEPGSPPFCHLALSARREPAELFHFCGIRSLFDIHHFREANAGKLRWFSAVTDPHFETLMTSLRIVRADGKRLPACCLFSSITRGDTLG